MLIGVVKEPAGENRVSVLPEAVAALIGLNATVWVEKGAGENAWQRDTAYEELGATLSDRSDILKQCDILLSIHPIHESEWSTLKSGAIWVSFLRPLQEEQLVHSLCKHKLTVFSLDLLPRTTRAQNMDTLSSMATVAGYKAVLKAADHLPSFFPMFMSAAGTISPAKVLVLGAGVAGLQSIASARKLGAVVYAFDVRSAVKEEVMSLGGKFVEVEGAVDDQSAGGYAVEQSEDFKVRQQQAIHDQAVKSDVIICTAQIPGRTAPVLIKKGTIAAMRPGSVIIDLAASSGGNCEGTKNNEVVYEHDVCIIGESNFPSQLPRDASKMFGKNLLNFLKLFIKDGNVDLNFEDDILQHCCICHEGAIVSPRLNHLT